MKRIKHYCFLLCILALLCVTVVFANAAQSPYDLSVNACQAEAADALGAVAVCNTADAYYLFLPASADRSSMTVWYHDTGTLTFNGTPAANGDATDAFAADSVTISGSAGDYTVRVLQAPNAAVFVTTESGSMDAVHADKETKEPGSITITDAAGNIQYNGALDYIKGRGNSTWELDKKPYNIKLGKKADLFGMGKEKKWCLLADFSDDSKLRNNLGYSYAGALGNTLTSDVVLVNLYCNGQYMGAYSLTEKVEIGTNRIDISDLKDATEEANTQPLEAFPLCGTNDYREAGSYKYVQIANDPADISGGYVLELEKPLRYMEEPSGFVSPVGQPVVIKEPEYASQKQVEYIYQYYAEFEEALYSPTGRNAKGKHYTDYIDIDELAAAYLVQEMTENFDGCSSSFYLYKDAGEPKFHIGPTWDLDLSLGRGFLNNLIVPGLDAGDPTIPYIYSTHISNTFHRRASFLGQALNHNDFISKVKTLWALKGHTMAEEMLAQVDEKADAARACVVMDALLWNTFGAKTAAAATSGYTSHIAALKSFITSRIAFMDNYLSKSTGFVRYDTLGTALVIVSDRTVYAAGEKATAAEASPRYTNQVFRGWSETPNDDKVQYEPGSTFEVGSGKILYPVWETTSSAPKTPLARFLQRIRDFFSKIRAFFEFLFHR